MFASARSERRARIYLGSSVFINDWRHHQIPADKRERGSVASFHCRGAYGLSGNAVLPITAELTQREAALVLLHGDELLLLPQLAIDIASMSSINAAAWRGFMYSLSVAQAQSARVLIQTIYACEFPAMSVASEIKAFCPAHPQELV